MVIDKLDLADYAKLDFWWKLKQGPTKIGGMEYLNPNFSALAKAVILGGLLSTMVPCFAKIISFRSLGELEAG